MANDPGLGAVRDLVVAGVRRADDVHAHIRRAAIRGPAPRHRPRRALPDVVRAERLQLRPGIGTARVRGGRIQGRGRDLLRARRAEGRVDDVVELGFREGLVECAVDGRAGFVEDGGDEQGLGDVWEGRRGVEGGGDEGPVVDDADGLGLGDGRIDVVVGVVVEVHLGVDDCVQRECIQAGRVGCSAVELAVE